MGRPINISDDTWIETVNDYRADYPRVKIKYSEVERYARNKGLVFKDGLIKKRPKVIQYIKKLNQMSIETSKQSVFNYVPLDIVNLLETGKSKTEIKSILMQREAVYQNQSLSAMNLNEELERYKNLLSNAKTKIKDLEEKIAKWESKDVTILSKSKEVEAYKKLINDYMYPEISAMLLDKEYKSNMIKKETFENNYIDSTKNVYDDDELNKLMGDFDD